MLDWFNAREATTVGSSLADYYLRDSASASKTRGKSQASDRRTDVQRLLRRAVLNARPLKLNLFKRAKLLGSFKWRLIDQGIDRGSADELTQLLLLQLSGGGAFAAPVAAATPPAGSPRRRIDPLLSAADEAAAKGNYAETVVQLQDLLAIDPDHVVALSNLGDALCFLGRYPDAERAYRRSVQIDPRRADTHLKLGNLLQWRGDFLGSETTLRRATKLEPRSASALCSLGYTLSAIDRVDDAKGCFEKALRLKPNDTGALCGLAWLISVKGRFEEADSLVRRALEIDPDCAAAQGLLVVQRRMTPADKTWLERTQRILARPMAPIEEARLRFATGKYFDDLGNHSQAFEEYRRANELRRKVAAKYDRVERTAWVDDVIRLYSADHVAQRAEGANDSTRPVFVVGMMRSGTSLVEQIIASHPEATGAGELQYWGMTEYKHPEILRQRLPDAEFSATLAGSYLKVLAGHSADAARIVDKAPANTDYLGLIHRVFPQARFIYMRRDPVDTCLSCYFQNFFNAAAFTMDLQDLAHYYREHHRLAAHWRSVLPKDVFLEVPYAELVADQEGWSRKIIEFIGLRWDPKVLEFHKTERAVLTASSWQVRQKMYSSSVGRSKNYQKFIGPLLKLRDLSP
jgi:tetratricopeptide (TPR) repeat protein